MNHHTHPRKPPPVVLDESSVALLCASNCALVATAFVEADAKRTRQRFYPWNVSSSDFDANAG